jgi:hypothetical protein
LKNRHPIVKNARISRNLQRICNGLNLERESRNSNMCKHNGLDGGPGESRTPDQRFRNWAVIPQLVCFQCLQFGQFRAVMGLVGSRTCNRSCNARPKLTFILLPKLIASVLRVRGEPDSSHSEIASDNPCYQHLSEWKGLIGRLYLQ